MGKAALEALEKSMAASLRRNAWRTDPIAYCRERLLYEPCGKQALILKSLAGPKPWAIVDSCNAYGKSSLSAAFALWVHENFDPSLVVVTAPTERQVDDVIFKEIRRLYRGPHAFPRTSRIEHHRSHMISGFTAKDESSFQGMRESDTAVVCDEHNGIESPIMTAIRGMLQGSERSYWLMIGNPTDPSSPAFLERERAKETGEFALFQLSAFEHPNIHLEIMGERPVVPAAVRLGSLSDNMHRWGEFVDGSNRAVEATDVDLLNPFTYDLETLPEGFADRLPAFFPARHWRPTSPEGFARILGVYPSQAAYAVYSEDSFLQALNVKTYIPGGERVVIGCDIARFGSNSTVMHVRRGRASIHHESFVGQDTSRTAERLKALCERFGPEANQDAKTIVCVIDDTGVGGGVTDQRGGYNFQPYNGKWTAQEPDAYPNARSEGLFTLAHDLKDRRIDLSRLPRSLVEELRKQGMSVTYKLDGKNRRKVLDKDESIRKGGRSPDDLDAMALCYSGCGVAWDPPSRAEYKRRDTYDDRTTDRRDRNGAPWR